VDYHLTLDGDVLDVRALFVAVANSCEYGNGAIVAPGAVLDDGLLDVVVVHDRSIVGRLTGARRLLDGTLHRAGGIVHRTVRRLVIETGAPTLCFHVDGDTAESASRLEAGVLPGALRIRA
jgi:diacylglycerol kinase (ATP)